MPSISKKGQNMPSSPIRKLVPFAEKARSEGKKIYPLNIGQPDIETPKVALDAVRNIDLKVIEYSHSAGFESYRKKLVGYYAQHNINVSYEDIIITTGGSEALMFAMMSCLDAGDELIIPEPFYANYLGFSIAGGIDVVPVTASIRNDFALPPVEEFEKSITPKTKGIMICNPSNPTGYLYTKEELEVLRDIAIKHDLYLFADEVYREFCYDGKTHNSIMHLDGLDENVILIDSVSKRYSECGARIGALITKNKEVFDAAMKFAQARLSPPTLAQILAEASLDVEEDYFTSVKEEYTSRRALVVEKLNAMEGVYASNPGGAFYTIAALPIDDADAFCQWMLESFDLNGETVMMAPVTGFYATKGLGKKEVRIAYVLNNEELSKAMDCLEAGLKAYPNRVADANEALLAEKA